METQRYVPKPNEPQLIILERRQIRICNLEQKPTWSLGRYDPSGQVTPDIALASGIASREHGWFMKMEGQWYFVDNPQNMNGTFYNGKKIVRPMAGKRKAMPLAGGDVLRIDREGQAGKSEDRVMILFVESQIRGSWTALSLEGRKEVVIGRDPRCDIVETLPYLSAKHAKITFLNGQYHVSDCKSTAGTFLNGEEVIGSRPLREQDCISLCDRNYFFLGDRLLYVSVTPQQKQQFFYNTRPNERPVILKADIDCKRVKNNSGAGTKELIRDIHLEIREGTLVALLGTAGAGKSTVMNCLNGMDLEGVHGTVVYRGVDLMRNFEQMKYLIGSVPQKKTFHKYFTPEREFTYAAKKRLPADTSDREIRERVDKTLEMLSMTGVRNNRNIKLSGGEQTRVNVGIELVADRDLLCLDEPDQGLSPNYKHELFAIMRDLAHKNGKSVLSIIHDVSEIDMFDQVIMLAKVDGVGRLAFSGTPDEARKFFGTEIGNAYALLEQDPKRFVR